jgi:HSP20 family protein
MFGLVPWRKRNGAGTLTRQEEFPINRLRDEFDAMFNRFFGNFMTPFSGEWGSWDLDYEDTDKEIIVRAEAPGFEADDFEVNVSGNWLTIRAEKKHESKEKDTGYEYAERRFQRSVTLPPGADPNKVEARYHSGVLELHFAKSPEAAGKRIAVKT